MTMTIKDIVILGLYHEQGKFKSSILETIENGSFTHELLLRIESFSEGSGYKYKDISNILDSISHVEMNTLHSTSDTILKKLNDGEIDIEVFGLEFIMLTGIITENLLTNSLLTTSELKEILNDEKLHVRISRIRRTVKTTKKMFKKLPFDMDVLDELLVLAIRQTYRDNTKRN